MNSVRIDAACAMLVVDAIEGAAEILASTRGMEPKRCHFFGVAVREAVINAIRHGGRGNQASRFETRFIGARRRLVVTVRDRGPGFDPRAVSDPLKPENAAKGTGRGILYMRKFADRVSFSFPRTGGTLVRLEKKI